MKKAAFLSMDSLEGFECYDQLTIKPLNELGWSVDQVSWRKPDAAWNNYDAVIVRSTWDYQKDPGKFLAVLEEINNSPAHLENDLSILKWNMNKNYLADLQAKNITIVETIWEKKFDENNLLKYFDELNCDEIIIKPNISANADNTYRLKIDDVNKLSIQIEKLQNIFFDSEFMVQPFMKSIIDEGEYSLFFFGGCYSHSILKKPKQQDFRVQEEHGGKLSLIKPDDELINISENILNKMEKAPLYARVDLIRNRQNNFALMELELIEPSLYFNMDPASPIKFAAAFDEWMRKKL